MQKAALNPETSVEGMETIKKGEMDSPSPLGYLYEA